MARCSTTWGRSRSPVCAPSGGLVLDERDRGARAKANGPLYLFAQLLGDVVQEDVGFIVVADLEDLRGRRLALRVALAEIEIDGGFHDTVPSSGAPDEAVEGV